MRNSILLLIPALVTILAISTVVFALRPLQKINVQLIFVHGINDITHAGIRDLQRAATLKAREAGLELHFKRLITIDMDPFLEWATLEDRKKHLFAWGGLLRASGFLKPKQITHVILPPIYQNGIYYLAGYARGTCVYNKRWQAYSMSNAELYNAIGEPRSTHSLVAFLHELSHTLGAHHDSGTTWQDHNIMHPDALSFITQYWPFSWNRKAKNEIQNCLNSSF